VTGHALAAGALLGLVFALFSPGCGSDHVDGNKEPTAFLTSGPVEGDTTSYSIEISWSGTDKDGFVSRYEYAVDPPSAFTEEEIAGGGPGIVTEELPGNGATPPVTRVAKSVGGGVVFFDWVHTEEQSHHFTFDTPDVECDSTEDALVCRFLGMHAVYVRAVDDDGAVSLPEKVAFTTSNVAPRSRITRPRLDNEILSTGAKVSFEWTGEDPDSPEPGREPHHYLFRGVRLDGSCSILICDPREVLGPFEAWEALEPGVVAKTVLLEPGQYIFGLAAVDEHGGVEPFLDSRRNLTKIQSFASGGYPILQLSWPNGTFSSDDSTHFELAWPVNTDFQCEVSCSAELYGEDCNDVRWGIDLPGPDAAEGWSPWTGNPVIPELRYEDAGIHTLYVQGRDTLGNVTTVTLVLDIRIFLFDRDVLYVDDSYDNLYPNDAQHDAFWRQLFAAYGIDPLYEFHCHGDNDRERLSPAVPTLAELGRYRLLVWVNFGSGYNAESALLKAASIEQYLGTYLAAGGQLWVVGGLTVPPMLPSPNGMRADLTYPILDDRLRMGTFAWDFMKLRTTRINNPKGTSINSKDNLWGVAPYPGEPAVYDSMVIDQTKLRYPYQLGVPYCDAIFDPIVAETDPGFRGNIDSLYVYRAYGPEVLSQTSTYHHRLNALRWHDPDPDPLHGRVQWFGFNLYYMGDSGAQETFNRSLDWFREGTP
jgi:hypothetical protein